MGPNHSSTLSTLTELLLEMIDEQIRPKRRCTSNSNQIFVSLWKFFVMFSSVVIRWNHRVWKKKKAGKYCNATWPFIFSTVNLVLDVINKHETPWIVRLHYNSCWFQFQSILRPSPMESKSMSKMLEPSLPWQVGVFKKLVNSSVYEHFGPLEHLTQNTLND